MELYIDFITARKRSLRRLCFYTCLSVHRGEVLSQNTLQVVSQHALQQVSGGVSQHALQVSRPTQGGSSGGSGQRGGLQANNQGGS